MIKLEIWTCRNIEMWKYINAHINVKLQKEHKINLNTWKCIDTFSYISFMCDPFDDKNVYFIIHVFKKVFILCMLFLVFSFHNIEYDTTILVHLF